MERLSLNILLRTLFGSAISDDNARRIVRAVEFVLRVAGRGMLLEERDSVIPCTAKGAAR